MSGPPRRAQYPPYADPYAHYSYYPYPQQQQAYPPYARPYPHDYGVLTQHMAAAHIDGPDPRAYQAYPAPQPPPEPRSSISLRYPPLPEIPARAASPATDGEVRAYIDSLKAVIRAHEQRDELLRLRSEAVGFEPKRAWLAWNNEPDADGSSTHPILGVRLLQKVDQLTRENERLGAALEQQIDARTDPHEAELAAAHSEIADCHRLITSLDQALTKAEQRAAAADRALEVACASNSTSITPSPDPPAVNGSTSPTTQPKKQQQRHGSPNNGRPRTRGLPASLPPNPRPPRRPPAGTPQ